MSRRSIQLNFRALAVFAFAGILPAVGQPQDVRWLETRARIEELAQQQQYAAALELGDQLVEQVTDAFGDPSEELSDAHLLLARVDTGNRDFVAAETNAVRAIQLREALSGPLSTDLIDPYILLGDTYQASREYELALGAYTEARSIGRRAYGLLNQEQLPIIDKMSEAALRVLGRDEARELQEEALGVRQRFYGDDSIEYLEAYYDFVDWLVRHHANDDANRAYFQLEHVIDQNFDNDPLLRVQLLRTKARRSLSGSRFGPNPMASPHDLEQALNILDRMDEPDPLARAQVLLDLGDWYVYYGNVQEIGAPYQEAWALLAEVEGGMELREQWFSATTVVRQQPFSSRVLANDPTAPWGIVEMVFRIDAAGRSSAIYVVRSDPPDVLDGAAVQHVAASRFRPQIVDGQLVDSLSRFELQVQYDPRLAGPVAVFPPTAGNALPGAD